jgi:hypothetical protein
VEIIAEDSTHVNPSVRKKRCKTPQVNEILVLGIEDLKFYMCVLSTVMVRVSNIILQTRENLGLL